jgi:protein-S-isoprenylcysteine O-methyltransferase Ste14
MGDRRYILSLWATVKRRRTLHLQDNGIYSYDKHFGYLMLSRFALNPHFRVFRPHNMEKTAFFSLYHSEMVRLPEGAHLMPEVDYGSCYAHGKTNIPVFLLNPIPMDVEICEYGHIHKIVEGDTLPDSLGRAKLYSMSSFLDDLKRAENFTSEQPTDSVLHETQEPIKVPTRTVQTPKTFRHIGNITPIGKKITRRIILRWALMVALGAAFAGFLILSEPMFRNSPDEYRLNQIVTVLIYLLVFWKSRVLQLTFSKSWVGSIKDCKVVSYTRYPKGVVRGRRASYGIQATKCIWTVETDGGASEEISVDTSEINERYFKVGERIRLYKTAKIPVKAHPPVGGEDLMCPLCGMTVSKPVCTRCGIDFTRKDA